jgi:hypothetical protein
MLSVVFALAGYCRADDQVQKDPGAATDLPESVLQSALFHVPDLTVDDVATRQVKGHPTVFIIDGQSCDRSVVLAIEENGDVHEIRFHRHPDGLKPAKISHAPDDLPDAVRTTAERVIPDIDINDVKSSQAQNEQRVYHLIGTVTEGEDEHYVTLTIEEDGGLLEARVIKPLKEVATIEEINAAPDRDPNDD